MFPRKIGIATMAAAAAFGSVYAASASLGGITAGIMGADSSVAASCDIDGVTTSYAVGWDTTLKKNRVESVTVAGINNACDGHQLIVSMTDSAGVRLGDTGILTIPVDAVATSHGVSMPGGASAVEAKLVENIHVAMYDN